MSVWPFGGYTQRMPLPADAEWGRMGLSARGSLIEIFVPRRP